MQPNQDAVHHAPRLGIVTQHCELEWKPAAVRIDICVDAARVRRERCAILCRERDVSLLSDAPHPQPPHLLVGLERRRAYDLGQIPAAQPPQRVHLPHAFLRRKIPLREQQVVLIGRVDVRLPYGAKRNRNLICNDGDDSP